MIPHNSFSNCCCFSQVLNGVFLKLLVLGVCAIIVICSALCGIWFIKIIDSSVDLLVPFEDYGYFPFARYMAYIMDTNEEERVKVSFCDNWVSVGPDDFLLLILF